MIVSIILIIAFLAFAFFGIGKLLTFQEEAKVLQFSDNLQKDIERMYYGSSGSQPVEYSLPKSIDKICFTDDKFGNLMFLGEKRFDDKIILYIDLEKTLEGEKSLCINNIEGKVRFLIEKNYVN